MSRARSVIEAESAKAWLKSKPDFRMELLKLGFARHPRSKFTFGRHWPRPATWEVPYRWPRITLSVDILDENRWAIGVHTMDQWGSDYPDISLESDHPTKILKALGPVIEVMDYAGAYPRPQYGGLGRKSNKEFENALRQAAHVGS